MDKSETDANLVRRVRAGDTEAFGLILRRYYSVLLAVARAYCNSRDDADDAVQNAWVLAYVHLGQLQDPSRLGPWLRRVAVNTSREGQRRFKALLPLNSVPEVGREETATTDTRLLLEQLLTSLSPETRLTVTLYYQREFSLEEIAAFQEVPVTTIKSRLRNARARLRKEWETIVQETPTNNVEKKATRAEQQIQQLPQRLYHLCSAGEVHYIAFSPDGTRIVTAAALEVTDTTFTSSIACWEAGTGNPLWVLPYSSWAFCPTFLPDSKRVAVSAGLPGHRDALESELLLIETTNGAIVQTLKNTPAAKSIAIASDGRFVALGGQEQYENYRTSGEQGMAAIYDLTTGDQVLKIAPHLNFVTAVAFSPDGAILATDSHLRNADPEADDIWLGGEVRLWDITTGKLQYKLARPHARGHRHNLAFSPDGTLLAVPDGVEGDVLLFETATGSLLRTLEGSGWPVFALAFSPDGAILACGCGDNAVRLWEPRAGVRQQIMTEFSHGIYALAFSPDGRTLGTADKKGEVQFWAL
jgi:RNA polymerase sigma factor (sigma-70 family)